MGIYFPQIFRGHQVTQTKRPPQGAAHPEIVGNDLMRFQNGRLMKYQNSVVMRYGVVT